MPIDYLMTSRIEATIEGVVGMVPGALSTKT